MEAATSFVRLPRGAGSRRQVGAHPRMCSLCPVPYVCAVSEKVTPRSMARRTARTDSASSRHVPSREGGPRDRPAHRRSPSIRSASTPTPVPLFPSSPVVSVPRQTRSWSAGEVNGRQRRQWQGNGGYQSAWSPGAARCSSGSDEARSRAVSGRVPPGRTPTVPPPSRQRVASAAHATHVLAAGRTSRRSAGIGSPHRSHRPYSPRSMRSSARSTSARREFARASRAAT